jgi:hypothetical protein
MLAAWCVIEVSDEDGRTRQEVTITIVLGTETRPAGR